MASAIALSLSSAKLTAVDMETAIPMVLVTATQDGVEIFVKKQFVQTTAQTQANACIQVAVSAMNCRMVLIAASSDVQKIVQTEEHADVMEPVNAMKDSTATTVSMLTAQTTAPHQRMASVSQHLEFASA